MANSRPDTRLTRYEGGLHDHCSWSCKSVRAGKGAAYNGRNLSALSTCFQARYTEAMLRTDCWPATPGGHPGEGRQACLDLNLLHR